MADVSMMDLLLELICLKASMRSRFSMVNESVKKYELIEMPAEHESELLAELKAANS